MISSPYSDPENVVKVHWSNERVKKIERGKEGLKTYVECSKCSEIIRGVVGHDNWNDAMLRRSAQLLLAPENEHFEGRIHLKTERQEGTVGSHSK